jgi:hypothetical protein
MNIRYRVTLTAEERQQLKELVHGGVGGVRKIKRAQILLAADGGCKDEAIAQTIGVGTSTVYRTKQRFVEDGLERALHESPRPGAPRKLGEWPEALDLRDTPELVQRLARRGLWLEQEPIAVDPRTPAAIQSMLSTDGGTCD